MIQSNIREAISLILDFNLGKALSILRPIFEAHPQLADASEVDEIDNAFSMMLHYMRDNAEDPDRKKLYNSLLRRTYRVAADLDISWRCKNVGFYIKEFKKSAHLNMSSDFIKTVLESYVSDVALLTIEPADDAKASDIFRRHQEFMERLFASVSVSCQWSAGECAFWQSLLTSPTIDNNDAQLIVSAISISAMNQFDINKTKVLEFVYRNADDDKLRERSLIGFVMSLNDSASQLFAEELDITREIISDKATARELFELQEQIFYCISAERDTRKINDEIIPDLTKNAPYRVNGSGMIEERDDDKMRDILHPDADEKAMEDVEKSMQKISDMQKQGADIYFGGFSHMKQFPFFSSASNWFLPYSSTQPDVSQARKKMGNSHFIDLLLSKSSFCESDKYSFTFAVTSILDRMPPKLREMLNTSDIAGIEVPENEAQSLTFIRRQYLQDLYRFFRLYPMRGDLMNPFDDKAKALFFISPLIEKTSLEKYRPSLAVFLHDRKHYDEMNALLHTFSEKQQDTLTYWLLKGNFELRMKNYKSAVNSFKHALTKDGKNEMTLRGLARSAMMANDYATAADAYATLLVITPERESYLIDHGLALMRMHRFDEAAKSIYEADYRYPDDTNVMRMKGGLLLYQKKPEEALSAYNKLIARMSAPEDYLFLGYCLWFTGKNGEAAKAFKTFLERQPNTSLMSEFSTDSYLMTEYGIDFDDESLMNELVERT